MKTYKQFINEIEEIDSVKKGDKFGNSSILGKPHTDDNFHHSQKITELPKLNNTHRVIKATTKYRNEYHLIEPNGKTSAIVNSKVLNKHTHQVDTVAASKNTVPIDHLYAHIVKHDPSHSVLMSSDQQSPGGKHVWQQLHKNAKKHGIDVNGWDNKSNKPINIGNKPKESEDEIWSNDKLGGGYSTHPNHNKDEHHIMDNHVIIASRK